MCSPDTEAKLKKEDKCRSSPACRSCSARVVLRDGARRRDHSHTDSASPRSHHHGSASAHAFDPKNREDGSNQEAHGADTAHNVGHAIIQTDVAEDDRRVVDDHVDAGGLVQESRRGGKKESAKVL